MYFPLSLWDISLWIAIMTIILLVTSEIIAPYSGHFGNFVIEKTRLRLVALVLGAVFIVTVLVRVAAPP